jgi:2-C-methyl-D-erythritol 2,4-cyclodiphosphate synthase
MSKGLAGHSDADVAIHALVDAILGASAAGDIGSISRPATRSGKAQAPTGSWRMRIEAPPAGYAIGNVDLTIVCEAPKIGPHREAMRARLATILGVDIGAVSVKATTTEKLGPWAAAKASPRRPWSASSLLRMIPMRFAPIFVAAALARSARPWRRHSKLRASLRSRRHRSLAMPCPVSLRERPSAAIPACRPNPSSRPTVPALAQALRRAEGLKPGPRRRLRSLTISKGKDDASKMFAQLPDSSLREMVDVVLEGMITQEIPVGECSKIDNFVRLLAPLPPENTAELVVMMVGLATADKPAKPGKLALCKG